MKTNGKKWLIGLFGLLFLFLILPVEKVRAADSVELGEWTLGALVQGEEVQENIDYEWSDTDKILKIKSSKRLGLTKNSSSEPTGKVMIENVTHNETTQDITFESITSSDLAIEVKNSKVKLVFSNISMQSDTVPTLKIENSDVDINISGNTTLANGGANIHIIEKGNDGKLVIWGEGTLSLNSNNASIGIGKKDGPVSNIEISCKNLVCNGTKIAIGSESGDVSNVTIKGGVLNCTGNNPLIGSNSGTTSDILISDSAIVSLNGQIKGNSRTGWNAMVFDKENTSDAKWKIYGDSFTLTKGVEIKDGEKFEEIKTGQTFKVGSGATLTLGGNNEFVNKGKLIIEQGGKIAGVFTNKGTIEGEGSITPKLQTSIELNSASKPYIGRGLTEADFQKGVDFQYQGDGALDFKWYKDNGSGQPGASLQPAPKDAGFYYVGISAAEGKFFQAVTEQKALFVIEKAEPTVTITAGPAMVNQKVKITTTVTGVNGEKPTGKLAFKIEKGSSPVTTKEVAVSNGTAEFEWTPAEKTTYSVTAAYVPAADGTGKNYKNKTSPAFSLTVQANGSNPGGNSQGGGSSSGGGSSQSRNSSSTSNTTKDNKQKEEKRVQDKKENKQKESRKESKSVFKDVKAKDKSYQAIKFAVEKGLMKEKNHKFHPSKKITAKDVVSALYKMAGKAEDKKASDKKELEKAETFLKETKILSQKDGDFVKTKEITKEQLIQLLYNYAEYKGYNTEVTGKLDTLKDSNKLSKSAKTPMKWALENGLIAEKNNKLSPKSKVTRKELATILYSFVQKEADWK